MTDTEFDEKTLALFQKYDTNGNGLLDKKEFAPFFRDLLKDLNEEMPDNKLDEEAAEGVVSFDLNADGVLQIDEFRTMVRFLISEKGYKLK